MKRFTDTEKWSDPWYRKLPPHLKCFWGYLCDRCDNAGVWKPDFELASFVVGQQISPDVLSEFSGRVDVLPSGSWWLHKFIRFQFGDLNPDCRPHQAVMILLKQHGIGYRKGMHTLKEKEKVQDKDKDKEKDRTGPLHELPENLRTQRMVNAWQRWMTHRRAFKKPASWPDLFNTQIEFLGRYDEPTAFGILDKSLRNGYQGLFEPNGVPHKPEPKEAHEELQAPML